MRIFKFFENPKTHNIYFGGALQVDFYRTCANFDWKWVKMQKQGVREL